MELIELQGIIISPMVKFECNLKGNTIEIMDEGIMIVNLRGRKSTWVSLGLNYYI
jgi:hypothetical protein